MGKSLYKKFIKEDTEQITKKLPHKTPDSKSNIISD